MERKRIVLAHATGPLKGLSQIVGILEGTAEQIATALEPAFYYGKPAQKKATHAKTGPRAVFYREWAALPSGRFGDSMNPAQR